MKSINNGWTAIFAGLAAVVLPIAWALTAGVSFTINGYDVDGGTDPICWKLAWWPKTQYLELQNFRMMPACYSGTAVKVTPLDLDYDDNVQVMHTNKTYKFKVEAEVDYTEIAQAFKTELSGFSGSVTVGNMTNTNILFRMVLCDTTKIGFCNPLAVNFLDYNEEEEEDYDKLTSAGWLSNVEEGQVDVLEAVRIGNHIFSPWLNMSLEEVSTHKYSLNTTINMKLPTGQRGAFFVIGHGHFQAHFKAENRTEEFIEVLEFLHELMNNMTPQAARTNVDDDDIDLSDNLDLSDEEVVVWVEAADAVPNNVVDVRPPPTIYAVSNEMRIAVGVVSGLFSLWTLVVFVYIVLHRDHVVMKLAQWHFLLWMVGCCLVSNVFVFTYMPIQDWHCRYADMFEFVPLTMVGCILVGRSWRVYVTISAAMTIGIRRKSETQTDASTYIKKYCVGLLTLIAKFPYNCRWSEAKEEIHRNKEGGGFRKKVTAWETARLILWLSLPQIVMQVAGVIVFDGGVETNYDHYMTEGRVLCTESGEWVRRVGVSLVATAYATSVLLAWISRDLPSAFNETDGIFQAATINTIVGLMALSLDQITNVSGTHPDVTVFLWAMTSLIVTSTAMGFIVMPKVNRVRSGEEIIISNLLAQSRDSSHPSTQHGLGHDTPRPSSAHINAENRSIHLKKDEPVPKGLERNLLGVNKLIGRVRNELVEGRTPNLKEWEQLIGKVDELHDTFERIEFLWTEEDEQEQE